MPVVSPERKEVVTITSFDDLCKVLLIRKIISQNANDKLRAITDSMKEPDGDESMEQNYFREVTQKQRELLNSYLTVPTLTEFSEKPELRLQYMWGGTFGVAILIGGVILQHLKSSSVKIEKIHNFLLARLLQEVADGYATERDMAQRIIRTANISIPNLAAGPEYDRVTFELISPVLEGITLLLVEYNLMDSKKGKYFLTEAGKRTLLHLVDAQRFIEDIVQAHQKFHKP